VPDLEVDIVTPNQTTVAALKHRIRSRLAEAHAARRLRFIHGGKILPDNAVLSAVLKPLPPPPRDGAYYSANAASSSSSAPGAAGKGKNVEGRPAASAQCVYVNCSIGDVLDAEALEAEARAATKPPDADDSKTDGRLSPAAAAAPAAPAASTLRQRPTPRGFDRLLTAGFTPAEVNQLRLQFRSIQASRHTPDTMPSPDSLRTMEDAWIDNNHNNGGGRSGGTGGWGGANGGEAVEAPENDDAFGTSGMLDVLVKGMIVGFMFPLGSVGWLVREEGLWSRRWKVFASFGFLLSLIIGMVRAIASDH
jgi:hypothetical protein